MNNTKLHIETIRRYITNAQEDKAFNELLDLVSRKFPDRKNEAILLCSDYNSHSRNRHLGIGEFAKGKNRIILGLLEMLDNLEAMVPETPDQNPASADFNIYEKLNLLEKNIQLILDIQYNQTNGNYLSFRNSSLWKDLEKESRELFEEIYLSEREMNLDNHAYVRANLAKVLEIEFNNKLFDPFRKAYSIDPKDSEAKDQRNQFMEEMKGNCKHLFFDFLAGKRQSMSINQMIDILYHNFLLINKENKRELKGWGLDFYRFIHKVYRIKLKNRIYDDFKVLHRLDLSLQPEIFVFTDYEVAEFKHRVLNILSAFQIVQ